jgi:cytoskeletal protein CcmA (bactofilin family)
MREMFTTTSTVTRDATVGDRVTGATVLASTLNAKDNVDFDKDLNVDGKATIKRELEIIDNQQ